MNKAELAKNFWETINSRRPEWRTVRTPEGNPARFTLGRAGARIEVDLADEDHIGMALDLVQAYFGRIDQVSREEKVAQAADILGVDARFLRDYLDGVP